MRCARIIALVALLSTVPAAGLTAQGAAGIDPCTLLTAAEVSAELGIKSLPGRPFLGSKTVCMYAADTNNTGTTPTVTVMAVLPAAFANGKILDAGHTTAVSGVGDDAYAIVLGGYVKLGVLKGSHAFTVTVTSGAKRSTPAQLQQMEVDLAKKAVARL